MYSIACRLAVFLASQAKIDDAKVDEIRFGLEVVLGEVIKWIILLIVAGFLGVLPGALFAMISFAMFRLVSGGAHCEDYWRCLAFSMLIYIGSGKLGTAMISFVEQNVLNWFIGVSCLICVIPILVWAPGEVVNRKTSPREKVLFKKLSVLYLLAWLIVTIYIIGPISEQVAIAGYLAVMFQVFSFTPWGFWIINHFDMLLSNVLGERRCSNA